MHRSLFVSILLSSNHMPKRPAPKQKNAAGLLDPLVAAGREPLADRLRPQTFEEYIGQHQLVDKERPLRRLLEQAHLPSLILWGPPGTGKTTLARILSKQSGARYVETSAVLSGVADIRVIMEEAERRWVSSKERTIVFLDEIHRFSKSQQDALLPFVERGTVTLIGATTENPSFEVNSALLSRARVMILERLSDEQIREVLLRALSDPRGYGGQLVLVPEEVLDEIVRGADGDARRALNALESGVEASRDEGGAASLSLERLREVLQRTHLAHDKGGDAHYSLISALHKSLRGSDVQASVYWMMRMLEAGEDPLYLCRRLTRFASEDIGMKDPRALIQAVSAFQACHLIGMPECDVILTQLVVYLAKAPKSNACYVATNMARDDVRREPSLPVPLHIQNAPTTLMKSQGFGKGYLYPPDADASGQTYLPELFQGRVYYKEGS